MGIEDRDWRKEEILQQRRQQSRITEQPPRPSGLSINQFLANNRPAETFTAKKTNKPEQPTLFIAFFLFIFFSGIAFLLYQYFI